MTNRLMISCYRGLAPVSFPADWAVGWDPRTAFGRCNGEAAIRFPAVNRAFAVSIEDTAEGPKAVVRELTAAEMAETKWGPFGHPWESYETAKIFGHGPVTKLDEL